MGVFAGQFLALCIASHHSGLIDCISADSKSCGDDIFTRRMRKPVEKTHLDEVLHAADPEILSRSVELLDDPNLLKGVESLARAILRANNNIPVPVQQQLGLIVRFLFSCLIDADRSDTADFEHRRAKIFRQRGNYTAWRTLADRLESHLASLEPRLPIDELRRDISEQCRDAAQDPKASSH